MGLMMPGSTDVERDRSVLTRGAVILAHMESLLSDETMNVTSSYAGVSPLAILSDTSQDIICFALDVSGIVQASIPSISCHSRYPPGPRAVGQHRVNP